MDGPSILRGATDFAKLQLKVKDNSIMHVVSILEAANEIPLDSPPSIRCYSA
jgi:hypothetical protein